MFSLPTLESLSQSLRRMVPTLIPGARADFWPNNLVILCKVVAMSVYEALLRARWIYRQRFASTADGSHLDVHGEEIGVPRAVAVAATGEASFAAADAVNVPAGTQFVSDAGIFYVSTSASAAASGTILAVALAAAEAGSSGNAPAGLGIRPVASISGLTTGTFSAGGGADAEADEPYRARLLERMRARPRGGNADDYIFWVKEAGVFDAAYVRGWLPAAGRVTVYPLKPGSGSARIPTQDDLTALAEHIEKRRPLCAEVVVAQASAHVINVTISGLVGDSEATRQEIAAELADLFDERAAVALPGENASFSRSWISEAVSRATGEDRHVLMSPVNDVQLATGSYPVLGSIGYS